MNVYKGSCALLITVLLALFSANAKAGVPIFFSWGGEKIVKVMALPNTPDFQNKDGEHVDVGYRFSQITLFFLPVYNYEEHWCGYLGNDKRYMDFDKATLDSAAKSASLVIPSSSPIPFWDAYGGKLVLALLVLLYILYEKSNVFKKKEATPAPQRQAEEFEKSSGVIGSNVVEPAVAKGPISAASKDFENTVPRASEPAVNDDILNDIFTKVSQEMAQGRIVPGLMARADVESNGDEAAKNRIYTKYRVKQCVDEYLKPSTR